MRVLFDRNGYIVDGGMLGYGDIYNAAYDGASDINDDAGFSYLRQIARLAVDAARRDPDISLTRKVNAPDKREFFDLLPQLPYVLGAEFVNVEWLEDVYNKIAGIINAELESFDGTPEEYFKSKNNALVVSGRVFFHLVETREEKFPFAFMATYSTKAANGAVTHLPLQKALKEFDGNQSALLGLLGAVSKAADRSDFITDLVESGELFSPLKFEPNDAYGFLREVPLY
ncbi:hypothetical protein FACS189490_08910 [Clostridia bacterium]|nr:hypothetical protein FACS189490_08910 [Clostridia bacterium]